MHFYSFCQLFYARFFYSAEKIIFDFFIMLIIFAYIASIYLQSAPRFFFNIIYIIHRADTLRQKKIINRPAFQAIKKLGEKHLRLRKIKNKECFVRHIQPTATQKKDRIFI